MKSFFSFAVSIFLFTILSNFACNYIYTDCSQLKNGKFSYYSKITNKKYFIERTDTLQIETDSITGKISVDKITWINPCEYYLTTISDNNVIHDKTDSFFKVNAVKISIIKTFPTYYIFTSVIDSVGKKELIIIDTIQIEK